MFWKNGLGLTLFYVFYPDCVFIPVLSKEKNGGKKDFLPPFLFLVCHFRVIIPTLCLEFHHHLYRKMVGEGFGADLQNLRRDNLHGGGVLVGEDVVDALAGILGGVGEVRAGEEGPVLFHQSDGLAVRFGVEVTAQEDGLPGAGVKFLEPVI